MSRLNVDELHSEDSTAGANIVLDDSKNVTVKGNLSVDGTIPADKLTGALPAISGANLTGIAAATDGEFRGWQCYTTSGTHTWTKPSGLKRVKVFVTGGGGGGSVHSSGGWGGGAGSTSIKVIEASALGATETVTVGAGGAGASSGSSDGNNGEATTFGSHCKGDYGRKGEQTSSGGSGHLSSGGDLILRGGAGSAGIGATGDSTTTYGGKGGDSFWGGGGPGGSHNQAGHGADCFGGGGGSSNGSGGGAALAGGNGKQGVCVVEEYF